MDPKAGTSDDVARELILRRFLKVDASNVADVLDTMGHPDQGLAAEFAPYPASTGRLGDWAYTIRGKMTPYPLGGDPEKMTACSGVSAGDSVGAVGLSPA